jgi:thiamine pyrophosphate-dependent acetolactate synthase large subunit-like protein
VEPLVVQAFSSTMSRGLMFGITTSTPMVLTIAQVESLKTQKRKTLTIMNLSIHDKIIPYVMGIQEPKDILEVLKKMFKIRDFF